MKRYLIILLSSCCLYACTKEGLPGPLGPAGPQGPPGEPGTGGGGATNIISVMTPDNSTFSWEQMARIGNNVTYRLKWKIGDKEGNTFRLPDSLTTYIDNGALLVYGIDYPDMSIPRQVQLSMVPADFHALSAFTYQLEKIAGRYVITIISDMMDDGPGSESPRNPFKWLKFIIIPQTATGPIHWG